MEAVTETFRVGSSILSLGTKIKSSRVIALGLFVFGGDWGRRFRLFWKDSRIIARYRWDHRLPASDRANR